MPEERNVRPCEELALPQPPKFGFRSQEAEQTSCTTSRLTLVLSMRERARLVWMRFIRLRVKICQLLRNTTFRGHNSMIRSRPDPLRAFTGSGCGYARLPIRMRTLCLVHFGGERTAACIPDRTRRLLAANIRVSIYSVCIPVVMRQLLLRAEAEATSWALPACVYLAATLSGAGASGQVPSYVLLSSGPFSAKM